MPFFGVPSMFDSWRCKSSSQRDGREVIAKRKGEITLAARRGRKKRGAKSAVARPGQRKFLGFSFTREREPRRRIAPKAIARFKERIREQTRRTRGISLKQMVTQIATYLRGCLGYFDDCQTPTVLQTLESWLRRRLRSVVWKQWKRGRTRFRELRKRGDKPPRPLILLKDGALSLIRVFRIRTRFVSWT